jgi:hypothetical protein
MRYYLLTFFLFITSAQCSELEDCFNSPGTNENGCFAEEMMRQEKTLETTMRTRLRAISYNKAAVEEGWSKIQFDEMKKQLALSQTQWKKYSEAWCRYQAGTMNGTGSAPLYVQCKTLMIKERLREISE